MSLREAKEKYDAIIVGGGIGTASLLYVLSRFTDIRKILAGEARLC